MLLLFRVVSKTILCAFFVPPLIARLDSSISEDISIFCLSNCFISFTVSCIIATKLFTATAVSPNSLNSIYAKRFVKSLSPLTSSDIRFLSVLNGVKISFIKKVNAKIKKIILATLIEINNFIFVLSISASFSSSEITRDIAPKESPTFAL